METKGVLLCLILTCLGCSREPTHPSPIKACAINLSTETECAEEDNVNIPLFGNVTSFVVEATHPTYHVGTDNCEPDFTNCPSPECPYQFDPDTITLFDDHETVVDAVRDFCWWYPNGMTVSVDDSVSATDMHYVRVYRRVAGDSSWPQFLVLYMDGNLRLIPHPPEGRDRVCFGSSVIVGSARPALRPIAEITSAQYLSASQTMELTYREGGSAVLTLDEVDREKARVQVTVNYETSVLPFATFRSMFVEEGNADVDHVRWEGPCGNVRDEQIMSFPWSEGSEWLFYRATRSRHNTSAPDILITPK